MLRQLLGRGPGRSPVNSKPPSFPAQNAGSVLPWAGAVPEPQRSGGGGAPRLPPEGETGKGRTRYLAAAGGLLMLLVAVPRLSL
jgi:hypothetical protein